MATTATTRERNKKAPRRIDAAALTAAASATVLATLDGIPDDVTRLNKAVQIAEDAERRLKKLRKQRDDLAVSLYVYDGVRAVNASAGIGRTQMAKIKRSAIGGHPIPFLPGGQRIDWDAYRELARQNGVQHVKDAATRLPGVAAKVVTLTATADAARDVRNRLALDMIDAGKITKTHAARIIGCDRSRVAHLLAARQKRATAA